MADTTEIIYTDPTAADPENNALSDLSSIAPNVLLTTVTDDDFESKVKVINAYNSAESLNDNVGTIIYMVDAICTTGVRKGRNGMPDTPCVNTYIIDANGTAYYSQSNGVAQSVGMMIQTFGDFTANDNGYLPVRVEEITMANGNTLKKMVICPNAA